MNLELTRLEAALLLAGLLALEKLGEGEKPDVLEALQTKLDQILAERGL